MSAPPPSGCFATAPPASGCAKATVSWCATCASATPVRSRGPAADGRTRLDRTARGGCCRRIRSWHGRIRALAEEFGAALVPEPLIPAALSASLRSRQLVARPAGRNGAGPDRKRRPCWTCPGRCLRSLAHEVPSQVGPQVAFAGWSTRCLRTMASGQDVQAMQLNRQCSRVAQLLAAVLE